MTILPNGVAVCGTSHHAVWCAELGLVHDKWFAGEITKHLKPGDVVIEGGAHIGTLTRAMLDAGAFVVAFEPNPEARECLVENCPEAEVYPDALGEKFQSAALVKFENAGASFVASDATGEINVVPMDLLNPRYVEIGLGVPFLPVLIKLDIEGYEAKALRGARETIARCRPVIISEVNQGALLRSGDSEDALWSLLAEMGYSIEVIQPDRKRDDPQYDIRAVPSK